MGRPPSWYGPSCEGTNSIDLAYLARHKMMAAGQVGTLSWFRGDHKTGSAGFRIEANGLLLTYSWTGQDGSSKDVRELIPFIFTTTPFGGRRGWFLCPSCTQRCRVVYGLRGHFRCRSCSGLRYRSQHESSYQRAIDKADGILRKLGDTHGRAFDHAPLPRKPKRMRWTTYLRLRQQYDVANAQWTEGIIARYNLKR
jgi:hypothetical protein